MPGGHHDAFTGLERIGLIVNGDNALAFKRRHKRVAFRLVRADALAFGKGEERDAESLVLDERFTDNLSLCIGNLILEQKRLLMLNII